MGAPASSGLGRRLRGSALCLPDRGRTAVSPVGVPLQLKTAPQLTQATEAESRSGRWARHRGPGGVVSLAGPVNVETTIHDSSSSSDRHEERASAPPAINATGPPSLLALYRCKRQPRPLPGANGQRLWPPHHARLGRSVVAGEPTPPAASSPGARHHRAENEAERACALDRTAAHLGRRQRDAAWAQRVAVQ